MAASDSRLTLQKVIDDLPDDRLQQLAQHAELLRSEEFARVFDDLANKSNADAISHEVIDHRETEMTALEAWLDRCETVAALWDGEFDSAADLRRIRNEALGV